MITTLITYCPNLGTRFVWSPFSKIKYGFSLGAGGFVKRRVDEITPAVQALIFTLKVISIGAINALDNNIRPIGRVSIKR